MARFVLIAVVVLVVLWLLLSAGVLPGPVARVAEPIVGVASSLTIPALIITAYVAPGLFHEVAADARHLWHRLSTRGHDIEELERKIVHLDRPYHMQQLGMIYANQGRVGKAQHWFERALEKDPESIDAKYHLGLCHLAHKQYQSAADLLEQVHAHKPDYDYGMANLRLAQAQQFVGNHSRAAELYKKLLQFYPGHPEGSYHYGLLLAGDHSPGDAHQLMRDLIFTVRHSPGFHRRRNRHWALKARWWLWRHRA
jgi:tetratricopeptide (TPR) repeat protein